MGKKASNEKTSGGQVPTKLGTKKHVVEQNVFLTRGAKADFRKGVNVLSTTNAPNPFLQPNTSSRSNLDGKKKGTSKRTSKR